MTAALELGQEEVEVKKPAEDDITLWSVTTLIGILDKPALLYWSAEQTAKAAIADLDIWQPMAAKDEAAAIKWLRDARFRKQPDVLTDAAFGTEIHRLCEEYALTGVRPAVEESVFFGDTENATKCLDQFDKWLQAFQPEYIATEVAVYREPWYAGTADAFLKLKDGPPVIVDYKASRKSYNADGKPSPIYSETALQLAAYRFADLAAVWRPRIHTQFRRRYYVLGPEERAMAVPVPKVEGGLGIKITPEFCHAHPVECDEAIWVRFLHLMDVAGFVFNEASRVIGEPLIPTEKP